MAVTEQQFALPGFKEGSFVVVVVVVVVLQLLEGDPKRMGVLVGGRVGRAHCVCVSRAGAASNTRTARWSIGNHPVRLHLHEEITPPTTAAAVAQTPVRAKQRHRQPETPERDWATVGGGAWNFSKRTRRDIRHCWAGGAEIDKDRTGLGKNRGNHRCTVQ